MKLPTRRAVLGFGPLGAVLASRVPVLAQTPGSPTRPIFLDISDSNEDGGPPTIQQLANGDILFRITLIQKISGVLEGKLTERITQVHPPDDEQSMPIATLWRLETAQGAIEGHYSGMFNVAGDGRVSILQMGEVIWVSRPFGHLYRAEATYTALLSADRNHITGALWLRRRS